MLMDTTVDAVMVNGPEDVLPAWDAIDWRTCEEEVRRLRQRIFKGRCCVGRSRMAGDWSGDCTPHDLCLRRLPVPA